MSLAFEGGFVMGFSRKGQGATEYLVLLAVVLIIALVSIALLGFFPSLAVDARITQSNIYWRGTTKPFAITDYTFSAGATNGTIVMRNNDATGTMTVTNITGSCSGGIAASTTIGSGGTQNFTLTTCPTGGAAGTLYDYNVTISYTTPNGIATKQIGTKGLVGKFI